MTSPARLPLQGTARRAAGRVVRRWRARHPVLAVVVLLDGEPGACRTTLDALLAQATPRTEVILVPLDETLLVPAHDRATGDDRVRVLPAVGTPRAEARRRAVAATKAARVWLLGPGAVPGPGAVAALLARRTPGVVLAGSADGDLSSRPEAARAPLLARVVAERDLLLTSLPERDDADGTLAAVTLLRPGWAGAPDAVVDDVRPGSTRQLYRTSPWPALDDVLVVGGEVAGALVDRPAALQQRRAGLVERELAALVEANEDVGDDAWARLVAALGDLTDDDLLAAGVAQRIPVALARDHDRAAVTAYVAAHRFDGDDVPTTVVAGRVLARPGHLPATFPEHLLEVTDVALRTRLARVRRDGDLLRFEVHAGLTLVDHRDGDVEARIDLRSPAGHLADVPHRVGTDAEVERWFGARSQDHAAGRLDGAIPVEALGDERWQVHVTLTVSGVRREGLVTDIDPRGSAVRALGPDGVALSAGPWPAADLDMGLDGTDLVVSGVGDLELVGLGERVDASSDGRCRVPLRRAAWGRPERPAPSGQYRLRSRGRPVAADRLLDRLPLVLHGESHRVVVVRTSDDELAVRLGPPLGDDELGPRAQARRQTAYAEVREPLDPGLVYLQAFTGTAPTDHPRAIAEELLRRAPAGTRLRWMVADHAAGHPAGTEPVLHRSRDWYDVLARAAYVVTNVDLERWFVRREGQAVLQTYHGYPSKRMGVDQWRARNWPPTRIAQALARSSGTWTALVTPQPDANRWYRRQYAYDGPILDLGYPRDDDLVGPGAAEQRARARDVLGAGERKVLLYAPTWRDDLATDFRAAQAEHHLDLAALAAALGEEWLVLLRGHRFHAPASGLAGAGLLDVTSYPEINDLILAADAAVLDYSSLRFDVALAGRPAVYLVPDLARYVGEVRGFLQPYRETAPGPLVSTTEEVVRELVGDGGLDGLRERTAAPMAELNARFHTRMDGHASERVVTAFFAPLLER